MLRVIVSIQDDADGEMAPVFMQDMKLRHVTLGYARATMFSATTNLSIFECQVSMPPPAKTYDVKLLAVPSGTEEEVAMCLVSLGMPASEAADAVKKAPATVLARTSAEQAEKVRAAIEQAGAGVEVKESLL